VWKTRNWKTAIRHNACGISYPYDKMCYFAALISLRRRRTYTSLETWKSTICSIFERTFLLKNLPITHVRQATIFAGQTVKFYRSVTSDRHLFRGLGMGKCQWRKLRDVLGAGYDLGCQYVTTLTFCCWKSWFFKHFCLKSNAIYRVSKKTLWKFNRLSCIINVAKQLNFYIRRTVL
jgi:hypothetical protein